MDEEEEVTDDMNNGEDEDTIEVEVTTPEFPEKYAFPFASVAFAISIISVFMYAISSLNNFL